ncbi:MAG TPA: FAD-binding oxidoreductase [Chthoniobacterales bacterium]|nr:FAD-binding oxidoreductase [Chthoniobacterales bacterium]
MDIAALKSSCKGDIAVPSDANYLELLHGNLWNRLIPDRRPEVIVRVRDEDDIIATIRFARAHRRKVVVRGGGHNWCQPTLRHGGILIDLSHLNQVISIDVDGRKAVVQPIISNRDAQKFLNAHGLAFPSGHCPQVKLSGYLLGGGMSWNQGVWGHGAGSVEAVEIVTAEGELITASRDRHQDYFWAARGSGSGFFGVATRYHLRLYPLPAAIHGASYYYPIEDAAEVAAWLRKTAPQLSASVELSLFLLTAPAELGDLPPAAKGKVCLVTATSFAETAAQALAELKPLDGCPALAKALRVSPPTPMVFEELFDASGSLWPEGLRNRVEAIFSDADGGDLVEAVRDHFVAAPSPLSLVLFVFFTGPDFRPPDDEAYSMSSRVYGGPWTMWNTATEDGANSEWHDTLTALLRPLVSGYYIGESDTVRRPTNAVAAYRPENWERIASLRAKYDPDGVFFDYFDGLGNRDISFPA